MVRPIRFNIAGLVGGVLASLVCAASVNAQAGEEVSYIAVVKGTDVYVRCGAAESYYPFAKINAGDMVKVTGEKYEWIRVAAIGPAFKFAFGYVKYAKDGSNRFRLAADGKSGLTLGRTEVIAPNLEANNNAKESWKSIIRLDADQTLQVLETIETDKDVIHKVALPPTAQGWISRPYLEKATEAQEATWKQMLAAKPADLAEPRRAASSAAEQEPGQVQPVKPAPSAAPPAALVTNDAAVRPSIDQTIAPVDSADVAAEVTPAEPKLPTLEDLNGAFEAVLAKQETAEVGPLRELYLDLARRSVKEPRIARFARQRADHLQIWSDIQTKKAELETVRARTKASADETEAVRKALSSSAEYIAVGRVAASTIYDGQRLPKLLRLQDASHGRTIAYLKPDANFELVNLIGNLVGIVGEKTYDESLRLNIIKPTRIDLLTPEKSPAPSAISQK